MLRIVSSIPGIEVTDPLRTDTRSGASSLQKERAAGRDVRIVYSALDATKRYLLYCDKGVMSELHASHLKDEGYRNVAVYRP